ncbi:hypothetical protein FH972_019274 [Carpinus fangiana]|uniref:Uncharacterized protein n=1 Tax=Carpinus fangiana TaxID=176857 RepID=A0A5N6RSX0_9ROSI|nr:hypothetical protein FH972_019274 [Carpinus fangiana]
MAFNKYKPKLRSRKLTAIQRRTANESFKQYGRGRERESVLENFKKQEHCRQQAASTLYIHIHKDPPQVRWRALHKHLTMMDDGKVKDSGNLNETLLGKELATTTVRVLLRLSSSPSHAVTEFGIRKLMGACFSPVISRREARSSQPTAKIVSQVLELESSSSSSLLSSSPCFVCNSDRLYYDDYIIYIPALDLEDELQANQYPPGLKLESHRRLFSPQTAFNLKKIKKNKNKKRLFASIRLVKETLKRRG